MNERPDRFAWMLFFGALLVYATTRLFHIEAFPIYFFCDEAVHSVQFHAMVANGWHSLEEPHELLPAYFNNGGMPNLSLSVYVQGIATLIFGQTVEVVRAVSALASLSGAFAIALILRRTFQLKEWWSVVLFLTVLPCWFLHTRTGFETVLMVSSYSWFIYFYLRYRYEDPRWIYAAALAGAATFYSYAPGQGVIGLTALLLLISDARYHWQEKRCVLWGFVISLVLLAPFVRFRLQHPEMMKTHLAILNSYWTQDLALAQKLQIFGRNYLAGFSPHYWFAVGGEDAARHVVPNQPYLPPLILPLALVGLVVCVVRFRESRYRLVLIALVVVPFSSALVAPGITRMLSMVVVFSVCAAIGFSWLIAWIRIRAVYRLTQIAAFVLLSGAGFVLLRGALIDGPTANRNYGLYGLQWGSTAVYRDLLPRYLEKDPGSRVFITHITSNSPEVFPEFFGWMNKWRVFFASLDDICKGFVLPKPRDLVLISAEEFDTIKTRPEIGSFTVIDRVAFPDGRPAYYLGHLSVTKEFLAQSVSKYGDELQPRSTRLVVNTWMGISVTATGVESGNIESLFGKGDPDVRGRPGEAVNVDIYFDKPTRLPGLFVTRETSPGTRISVWTTLEGKGESELSGGDGVDYMDFPVQRTMVDHVRVEFTSREGLRVIPKRIDLSPRD